MTNPFRILCIGDSHTAGFPLFDPMWGGDQKSSYEYWLEELLIQHFSETVFHVENHGICGQTSAEVYYRFKSHITQTKPYNLVIYWAGANDLAVGYPVSSIWQNLSNAYELAKKNSLTFVLVTIPPMWQILNRKIRKLNQKIREPDKGYLYHYVDVYSALENQGLLNSQYDSGDGVHLSIDGYNRVGEVIFNTISNIISNLLK
ncbi:MAG: hypothetical protein JSV04_03335 [Candidatus Heimdallarchaeota archaeon]|nr:MAG: hypothetical protein JSV04_03335 [Candidatus Heimdallarchaeota archaeon]